MRASRKFAATQLVNDRDTRLAVHFLHKFAVEPDRAEVLKLLLQQWIILPLNEVAKLLGAFIPWH